METSSIELILFFLFIILSGFLTASEIAISSFGDNKIEELKEKKEKLFSLFESIRGNPEDLFGTIRLINIVSIIISSMLGFHYSQLHLYPKLVKSESVFLQEYGGIISFVIALMVISTIVLICTLLIPKAIGFKFADGIGKLSAKLLVPLSGIFKFPVRFISSLSNFFLIPFKEKTNFSQTRPSEDEILGIISNGVKSGTIDETEQEIIENIFEFNDLKANEVMVPRTEMIAVDLDEERDIIIKDILRTGHSLIPAYRESPDNIIGVLHTKDFTRSFIEKKNYSFKSLIRPAYFIPETKLISEVLKEMQRRGDRLAVVTDEYGGTEGLITMEDILEEIVGEIKDKTKKEIDEYTKLPDDKYYVLGSMSIDDFNETFNIVLPESEEYNTIAGFIALNTGKIFNTGELYEFEGLKFELIKKIRQKMVQFKVYSDEKEFKESNTEKSSEGED
ncbi:MAG: HlyC/CorC family transporter [Ignavibacteriaceae bacterium]|nr:HlyC/CorC family transporter [Ignavibacteriaceae bacterium]